MIDIDKDYLITVNLKNTKIKSDKTLFFYNTDLNICNIFIQLVCTGSDKTIPDDLIVEFAVLKPETNEFKPLDATLISKEDLLYQVDLTTDYLDIIGTYECEIRVSGTIDNENKCFTSESFDYVVRPNITAKLNNQIKQDKNLPILEKLIKEVNDIGLGIEMNQVQLKKDDNLVGDNKSIVGAINQLREDVNSGGKVELKDYQKKTDENLATEEKTIVGAVNEINSQCKDIATKMDEISNPFSINSFSVTPSVAQKGSTINVTVKWSYNKDINSQTLNNATLDATLREKTFSSVKTDVTYTLNATSTNNISKTKSGTVKFYNGIYYGKSSSTTYNATLISSLTKTLSDSKARTITVNAGTGEYIYYCLPTRLGVPSFNVGGFDGGFTKVATINFTNSDSYAEDYDIYKSTNANLGNSTVVVK